MGFEMEAEEVEAVLETIWDLHDKVSDAIHALSRAHFLRSVRRRDSAVAAADGGKSGGFVYVKGGGLNDDGEAAVQEARSLHAIRAALEDLEDQLEFFHTVQSQQQAERDIAVARLEQSRIILAIRLRDHQGKNYKVIHEALDFVHNVYKQCWSAPSENTSGKRRNHPGDNRQDREDKSSNFLMEMIASSLAFAKNGFRVGNVGSLLQSSAVFTVSMLALLHLHRFAFRGQAPAIGSYKKMNQGSSSWSEISPRGSTATHLDISLAKG